MPKTKATVECKAQNSFKKCLVFCTYGPSYSWDDGKRKPADHQASAAES